MSSKVIFTCPECNKILPENVYKCTDCDVVAMRLMSLPYHCKHCHCQYSYHKNNDREELYCWCCRAECEQSDIDDMILDALSDRDGIQVKKGEVYSIRVEDVQGCTIEGCAETKAKEDMIIIIKKCSM